MLQNLKWAVLKALENLLCFKTGNLYICDCNLRGQHPGFLVQAAVLNEDGFATAIRIPEAGVRKSPENGSNVCIVVRTYSGHSSGQYNIYQLVHSLQKLNHRYWHAYLVATDMQPYESLDKIVSSFRDRRLQVRLAIPGKSMPNCCSSLLQACHAALPFIYCFECKDIRFQVTSSNATSENDHHSQVVHADKAQLEEFSWKTAGFKITDTILEQYCSAAEYKWLLITNGDNW